MRKTTKTTLKKATEKQFLSKVLNAIKSIKYGYVQITIQDSKVVQIDKTEKIRLDNPAHRTTGGKRS